MSENFEHNVGDHEDPLPGPTWIIGFLGEVLLTVIMLGLTAIYHTATAEEHDTKVVSTKIQELESLNAAQTALITGSPKWIETEIVEGEGDTQVRTPVKTLAIPVDQAMAIIVQEAATAGTTKPAP